MMIKTIIFTLIYSFSILAQAGYTVTWVPPTENTDGSPLTDLAGYKLWCLYAENDYGNPAILPATDTEYVKAWAGPGDWKCKMRAFNEAGVDSADSQEVFFTLVDTDGDGNGHIAGNEPPPIEPPPIPVRGNELEITRKGYFTIVGPDGDTLMNDDETGPRQCTSLIECVERVTKDGRSGAFTIASPPYEVKYE